MIERIVDKFKPKDKKKEDFRYKRIYRTKSVTFDENNMEESIYAATKQFVFELLNFERQMVGEIESN